ncbi:hypothetical protein HLH34_00205 [Gluconacetobacter azotocaptans]|uniref:Uncharacterized protein n=1 Tax=Gluconacetobacter azotocaptans TaxID=142834 RepID=A0A7W4JP82_9PROT|nr:hypothetical protein [Gluconacetobacter azotocaptans]MBB2188389.1 hypothetical protein [Gluconacetobacter azotocaptans]MBM9400100.1 hypothetical protein [Gluconacetobacter azotocaptans]
MKTSSYRDTRRPRHPDIPSSDRTGNARAPGWTLRDRIEGYFVALIVTLYLKLT